MPPTAAERNEIMEALMQMLSFPFIMRAVIAGTLVALCAALLGVSLVLKKYSMIGDGLSHVGFGALAVAAAANAAPLAVAIPVVIAAAFLLLRISSGRRSGGDAAIAMLSTASLAVGVIVVTVSGNSNIDIGNYMFGSIFAVSKSDLVLTVAASLTVILLYLLFYNKIFTVTFDESFARATIKGAGAFNTVIAVLSAVIVVLGMKLMGALLISGLIIFPPLTAMRIFKSFKGVVICSAVISVLSFLGGVTISYFADTPPGATIIAAAAALYLLFSAGRWIKSRF